MQNQDRRMREVCMCIEKLSEKIHFLFIILPDPATDLNTQFQQHLVFNLDVTGIFLER